MEDARNLEEDAGGGSTQFAEPVSVFSNYSSCEDCVQARGALRPRPGCCGPAQAPHYKVGVNRRRRRLGRRGPIQGVYPQKGRTCEKRTHSQSLIAAAGRRDQARRRQCGGGLSSPWAQPAPPTPRALRRWPWAPQRGECSAEAPWKCVPGFKQFSGLAMPDGTEPRNFDSVRSMMGVILFFKNNVKNATWKWRRFCSV